MRTRSGRGTHRARPSLERARAHHDGERHTRARYPLARRRGRGDRHRRGCLPRRAHGRDGIQGDVLRERFVQVRRGARRALAPLPRGRVRRDAGILAIRVRRRARRVGPSPPALLQHHQRPGARRPIPASAPFPPDFNSTAPARPAPPRPPTPASPPHPSSPLGPRSFPIPPSRRRVGPSFCSRCTSATRGPAWTPSRATACARSP